MSNNLDCPVLRDAQRVLSASNDMTRALRTLKRSRRLCRECSRVEGCQVWGEFNRQIDIAIQEINQEWGLS